MTDTVLARLAALKAQPIGDYRGDRRRGKDQ
jgi:hypothetical protein